MSVVNLVFSHLLSKILMFIIFSFNRFLLECFQFKSFKVSVNPFLCLMLFVAPAFLQQTARIKKRGNLFCPFRYNNTVINKEQLGGK